MYNYSNYEQKKYYMPESISEGNPILSQLPHNGRQNALSAREGFMRGNMFSDLFEPYIAVEPFPLKPINEREDLLNHVRDYGFATIDLGLYLDVHPEDREKILLYNECMQEGKRYTAEFEQRYGPLTLDSDTLNNYPWMWVMPPWPWEVK